MSRPSALLLALSTLAACATRSPERPPEDAVCAGEPQRPPGLVLAGSGSNLALVHAIVRRRVELGLGEPPIVEESIGSGGAVAALRAGAIDVGLASRPLKESERSGGITEIPLARVPMALVHHGTPRVKSLDSAGLAAIFDGRRTNWDSGRAVVPLLREPGDSGNAIVARVMPELGALLEEGARRGRFVVAYTDQEMRDLLVAIDGSVGFLDLGTLRLEHLDLVPVAIDGLSPGDPGYPLIKPLSFLLPADAGPEARAFVEFATSAAVADILEGNGFLPPETG